MKGKEGSGDPEGREAKSGLALSGRWLNTSSEKKVFLLMLLSVCQPDMPLGVFKVKNG